MPSAERREGKLTGFWYGEVDQRHKGGVRFRRRYETMKEAKAYEAYVKECGVEPPDANALDAGGLTFGQWMDKATAANATWKRGRDRAGELRRAWLRERFGHLTMPMVTTDLLETMLEELQVRPGRAKGSTMSAGTLNNYLSGVSGVFTFAVDHPQKGEKPVVAPNIPWREYKGQRIHWFSQAQEDVLVPWFLAQGWHTEALTLRVLCATGLRWSEFEGLEPHQCQPEWVLLDDTKTDTPRDVPIDDGLARELKAMVVSKGQPTYWTMRTRLMAAVEACGYSPKLGIHNARHGTATRLIKLGVNPAIVKDFLGHKDIKTTMKYVHVESADLREAMKKMSHPRGEKRDIGTSDVVAFQAKSTG